MDGGVVVEADFPNQYLADCNQNCIPLLHQGMVGSSAYNFVPGRTYFFGRKLTDLQSFCMNAAALTHIAVMCVHTL